MSGTSTARPQHLEAVKPAESRRKIDMPNAFSSTCGPHLHMWWVLDTYSGQAKANNISNMNRSEGSDAEKPIPGAIITDEGLRSTSPRLCESLTNMSRGQVTSLSVPQP